MDRSETPNLHVRTCTFDGCDRPHEAKGLCKGHRQQQRQGRPLERLESRPRGVPNIVLDLGTHLELVLTDRGGAQTARVLIDREDYPRVQKYRWHRNNSGYARAKVEGRTILMHRLLLDPPADMEVDHANGDRLDNRSTNLKAVTSAEQKQNQALYLNNRTGYRGVSWDATRRKWCARVNYMGRPTHLGYFEDVHEAGRAAHEARERLFSNHQTRPALRALGAAR